MIGAKCGAARGHVLCVAGQHRQRVGACMDTSAVVHDACCACLVVPAADMLTADPSLGLDGLYTVLGLLLGVNAYNERTALTRVLQQRAGAAADAGDSSESSSK